MSFLGNPSGELVSLAAALVWSLSTLLYRIYGSGLRATQLNLFKNTVAVLAFFVTLLFSSGLTPLGLDSYSRIMLSGIIGIAFGDSLFFMSMSRIGGALASAIQCLAPPLTAIGGWFFLGEDIGLRKSLGLILVSTGIAAMVLAEKRSMTHDPISRTAFVYGVGFAILAACCQAIGVLIAREPLAMIPAHEGSAHRLIAAVFALVLWESWSHHRFNPVATLSSTFNIQHRWQLAGAAMLGTFGGLTFMVYGITHAPVGVALAITSSYPVWLAILEYTIFKRAMSLKGFLCMLIAVVGLFVVLV
jgi:drug/metabolite transporter (DMT)-like permease